MAVVYRDDKEKWLFFKTRVASGRLAYLRDGETGEPVRMPYSECQQSPAAARDYEMTVRRILHSCTIMECC